MYEIILVRGSVRGSGAPERLRGEEVRDIREFEIGGGCATGKLRALTHDIIGVL
jgi:hypothetical protein